MRSTKGEIITQLDLHDSEYVSNIKYDILSIEGLDKIHICLDLLKEYNYIPNKPLKELYEDTVGIYKIEREEPKMWKMLWNHEILSLFQMNQQSGINGIETLHPTSVEDLAILNSTIRLMAQEKGGEMPTEKLARFKADPSQWDDELRRYGLGEKEKEILEPVLNLSYGLCIAQEQFMQLVQLPELGGFPLEFADRLRKSIAKKNPKEYEQVTNKFFEVTEKKGCNYRLCNYVWRVLIAMSRGYGFNLSHTLAYSLVGLQEMNLAYKYPILFWNCACLIADSGGDGSGEELEEEDLLDCVEEFENKDLFYEEDEEDEENEEENNETKDNKKKKVSKHDYGKVATAIGKMMSVGIEVAPPDINESSFTFSPDLENNTIRFGLSGISTIGEELIKSIIKNRPYTGIEDFLNKNKVNKPKMVNLIKSGAFNKFGASVDIMHQYIDLIADKKKRVTLQNMKMLIDFKLIPEEYDYQCRIYNFTKYIKRNKINEDLLLDNIAFNFYEKSCDLDDLQVDERAESGFSISKNKWDKKYYQKEMDKIRPWVKTNSEELKEKINNRLWKDMWNKYCLGNLSKWEMDSVSCYFHEHELENIDQDFYHCVDYFNLPEEPEVESTFKKDGRVIPLFKISRIMGTVLDKDKNKNTVTLLTKNGVVNVKIYGNAFANYDKQLSVKNPVTGKKTVIEKSWFKRGNKIIVTGIRRGSNEFVAKKYKNTPYHLVELITNINDGILETKKEREEIECQ